MAQTQAIDGRVTAVRGAVLDIAFNGAALPPIDDALVVTPDKGAPIIAEVQSHLDEATVRAIALQSTAGLRRGVVAHATGGPLEVPVGEAVLGRLLDLTGAIGDKGKPLGAEVPRRPIHRSPPPLAAQSGATELFSTGIKVIDLEAKVRTVRAHQLEADRKARAEQVRLHALAVRQLVRYLRPNPATAAAMERETAS